jgi:hypothetical protein
VKRLNGRVGQWPRFVQNNRSRRCSVTVQHSRLDRLSSPSRTTVSRFWRGPVSSSMEVSPRQSIRFGTLERKDRKHQAPPKPTCPPSAAPTATAWRPHRPRLSPSRPVHTERKRVFTVGLVLKDTPLRVHSTPPQRFKLRPHPSRWPAGLVPTARAPPARSASPALRTGPPDQGPNHRAQRHPPSARRARHTADVEDPPQQQVPRCPAGTPDAPLRPSQPNPRGRRWPLWRSWTHRAMPPMR